MPDALLDPQQSNPELLKEMQRLRESEHHYRLLAEISRDIIFVIDRQGDVMYVNPYAALCFDSLPEALIGKKMVSLFPPEVAEQQTHTLDYVLRNQQPFYIEAPTNFGGDIRWLGSWLMPYYALDGQVVAVLGVSRDITERRQIENDLRRAKEYAEKLIQTANVIVVGLDNNGNIRVFNKAAESITGYKASEVAGKNWFQIFVPRERYPEVWEVFSTVPIGELQKKFENPILTRDGEERIISWQNSLLQDGKNSSTISFGMDVTERRRTEQVQAALYRISEAALAAQSLDELYSLIHEVILDLMPTRNFYIGLYDPAVDLIDFPYHWDEKDPGWLPHGLDNSLTSYVLRTGKAQLITPLELEELETRGEIVSRGIRPVDWLGVPLKAKDETIGVMVVQSYDEHHRLTEGHKHVLGFMSTQVAMAIERKRAEAELAESEERYRTLVELSPDAIAVHQRGNLVFVNQAAVALMGARDADQLLGMPISQVVHPDYRQRVLTRVREALANNSPLPSMEEKFVRLDGSEVDVEVSASPISFHGEQVMQVIARDITQRKEQEERLIQAGIQLSQAYQATLEGWSRALELRERETAGHSQRVVERTLKLAQLLGIEQACLVHIHHGALLHDIGKMGIPDEILLKPGPLNDEEWVIMRQHPVYAYEMLRNIPYLALALEIPHYHHERWDGSGYPLGLKGVQIPLAARIFSVVDVYDALCSERPYRPAWPEAAARDYLINNTHKLFDPQVVEAFWEMI